MAEFPALPLWTDAYLADTRHLSTCEHGAYVLLLIEAWRRPHCDLPDDDKLLARLAGMTATEWAAVRDTIMAFWTRDGRRKTWTQKRLTKERDYVALKRQSQRDNIAKRWNKKTKDDTTVIPSRYQNDTPTPTPTPTYIPLDKSNGAAVNSDKQFWDNATAYLNGKRSMIGKWCKEYGQPETAAAITAAQIERAVEPIAYIEKTLRRSKVDECEFIGPC